MKKSRLIQNIEKNKYVNLVSKKAKSVSLPGFSGNSIFEVGSFFIKSLSDDNLVIRATSMSFNFFLALFPAIIFLFTLIPYIPIKNLDVEILSALEEFMPKTTFDTLRDTITEIVQKQKGGLLSFGFITAIYFASNGFYTMMLAFNKISIKVKKEGFFKKRGKSIFITILISLLLIITVIITIYAEYLQFYIYKQNLINSKVLTICISVTQKVIFSLLVFYSISLLYNIGSAKIYKWPIVSAGAVLATLLSLLSNTVFSYYVNNFNSYNKLYGSIGTIIVLMLLIYINCLTLLIGYELNSSVDKANIKNNIKKNNYN